MNTREIERKWLAPGWISELDPVWVKDIYTAYLHIDEKIEVRISRRLNHTLRGQLTYAMATKIHLSNKLERLEFEVDLSKKQYEHFLTEALGTVMHKHCRTYELNADSSLPLHENNNPYVVMDLTCVDGGFYLAEIEFYSREEAENYILPYNWQEVTGQREFLMKNYYRNHYLK